MRMAFSQKNSKPQYCFLKMKTLCCPMTLKVHSSQEMFKFYFCDVTKMMITLGKIQKNDDP